MRIDIVVRYGAMFVVWGGLLIFILFFQTPIDQPAKTLIIEPGTSFGEIAEQLKREKIIPSRFMLKVAVMLRGGATQVQAGPYRFEERQSLVTVAGRLVEGRYDIEPERVVFPEGLSVRQMAQILMQHIGKKGAEQFIVEAGSYEGYLFPDTYFILPTQTPRELVELFTSTFEVRTADLKEQASTTYRSWSDVVIMASLVEEEARTMDDKRLVAGILWKRLDEGMRLQIDAPFAYLLGKESAEVTQADLDSDSPYNTYQYAGLPPAPISNPGLETLEAVINPQESDYWFYLSDADGIIHYAATYEDHLANKELYLE